MPNNTNNKTRIAVISDIHANKAALDNVLNDINGFNPDMIFCLGDLILAGYDPNGTMNAIFDLKEKYKDNFKIIQGNTDKLVYDAFNNKDIINKAIENFPCMGYSLEQDIKITDKKYIEYVAELQENETVEINGLKIMLCHGSPRNQNENIYPELLDKTVCDMTDNTDADLILAGHTHIPCGYSLSNSKTVVNVGSVGRSMTPDKTPVYLRLTVDVDAKFEVEHKKVKYDNISVSNIISNRGFKCADVLAKMYLA